MKNYPITIETGEHAGETVWVHRSIAVAGFIFCRINNEWCVLANQRGEGAPRSGRDSGSGHCHPRQGKTQPAPVRI